MSKALYYIIISTYFLTACSTATSLTRKRELASQNPCHSILKAFISRSYDSSYTIERKLATQSINKDYRIIVEGDNETLLVTLSDGTRGVFKPDITKNQKSSESEIVAYQVSKLLGFDLVPPTVRRSYNGRSGSLQLFIENASTADRSYIIEADSQEFRQQILDYILINGDRNGDNFLVGRQREIYSIDHEKSFAPFWEDSKTVAPDYVIFILVRDDMKDVLDKIMTTPISRFEHIARNLPQESRDMLIRRILLLKKEMIEEED